ncbi:MAG: GNAT family N-acetyltransferase [Draconibacterium sp.]|nr:GNAT family N-acetyltransferase [Draconibacterium sp.]
MIRLTNENVTLREFTPDDKYRLVELANNPKISINLRDGFPNPYTISDAESFLEKYAKLDSSQILAIEYNGVYAGNIGLHKGMDVYRKSAELGYFLGEPFWNLGIMTKAVNLICDFGFKSMDIVRIHAGIFEYNPASMRVLEKCGFKREGIFEKSVIKNGAFFNEIRYAKIKNE